MGRLLWLATLVAVLALPRGAAGDYIVDGTQDPPTTYGSLGEAITQAKSDNASGGLTADFKLSGGTGMVDDPAATSGYYDFNAGNNSTRFEYVTITGTGTDKYQVGFTWTGTPNDSRVFVFTDTKSLGLKNLEITGGNLESVGLPDATGTAGSALYYTYANSSATAKVVLDTLKISGNTTTVTQNSPGGNWAGGAVYIDYGHMTGVQGTVTFTDVELSDNKAVMANGNAADVLSSASGGGARLIDVKDLKITNGTVKNNEAVLEYGSHAAGGGLAIEANYSTTAAITGTTFAGNKATVTEGNSASHASGGAVYFYKGDANAGTITATVTSAKFEENAATTKYGTAQGGAIHYERYVKGTLTGNTFSKNQAVSTEGSARGGAVSINCAEVTDGYTLSGNTFSANTAQGGLAASGGALFASTKIVSTSDTFTGNIANVTGDNGVARGGALYLDGTIGSTITKGEVKNNVAYSKKDDDSSTLNVTAQGGGVYAVARVDFAATTLSGNEAAGEIAQGGAVYGEGIVGVTAGNATTISGNKATGVTTGQGAGIYAKGNALVASTSFSGNEAKATGATGNAQGGGLYGESAIGVSGSTFSGNKTIGDTAQGGGIFGLDSVTLTSTNLTGNTVEGTTLGQGGALYGTNAISVTTAKISGNTVSGGTAQGGGIYAAAGSAFTSVEFSGNEATGTGAARGGAIFGVGAVTVTTGSISGNTVSGATAQGGGIYALANVALTDTSVTNNTVSSGTSAEGGGIYMDTSAASSGELTIKTTAGKTALISGNKAGAAANGIYFGGSGVSNAVLNINSDGVVNMLDPIRVEMATAGSFALNRSGTGRFKWGGANTFNVADGATIDLKTGDNYLAADFKATAVGNTDFTVEIGGTLGFDGSRSASSAMFTFGGGLDTLTFEDGTKIVVDLSSELMDGTHRYLLADQYDGNTDFNGKTYVSGDAVSTISVEGDTNKQVWLTTQYTSVYHSLFVTADPNTSVAVRSGALTELFRGLTAEQRAQLTSSEQQFNTATPGWYMNQVTVGRDTVISGAETARKYGLGTVRQYNGGGQPRERRRLEASRLGYASVGEEEWVPAGARFWSGYVGDFDRVDSSGGYYGYKADRNGFIAGLNYDNGYFGTIGLYGGYTHTKTDARDISSEVKADTGHVGVIGRLSPLRELPKLSLAADAGYTFSSNDSRRGSGSLRTTGEFDQKYYTVGLELEYVSRFGDAFVTPFLSARYVSIHQDAFTESGALAAHVDEVQGDVFNTRLGASFGVDVRTGFGLITPSASVAWRHDFGDRQYSSNAFYQGVANPIAYTMKSAKADRDSIDVGAAIRAQLGGERPIGVNVGYNLNASSNRKNHSVYVGFDLSF